MAFKVIIEQTNKYPKRMKYIHETNSFIEKDCDSLSYVRNVNFPYGWIKESGTPPQPHFDTYIITRREFELGDEAEVDIIGVFWRSDGDHKLVGVLTDNTIRDFSELSEEEKEELYRLYGKFGKYEGESWYGREKAEEIIADFFTHSV